MSFRPSLWMHTAAFTQRSSCKLHYYCLWDVMQWPCRTELLYGPSSRVLCHLGSSLEPQAGAIKAAKRRVGRFFLHNVLECFGSPRSAPTDHAVPYSTTRAWWLVAAVVAVSCFICVNMVSFIPHTDPPSYKIYFER